MKPAPTYLTRNRHGTFYFRMVIPASLRPLTKGKREIRRSLKTDSERLALKRARQHAVRFDSIFDRALRMTERIDYEPSQEDFDLYDELHGSSKSDDAGVWSSPDRTPKKSEPALSDAEIEERQRRQYIAKLLTGRYDRPIRDELEPLAQKLLALSRSYQPTELPKVLPRLRDELVTVGLTAASAPAATESPVAKRLSHDPKMASWTLYHVWQHQLERDRADKTTSGGQAKHGGTLAESERRARVMTVLTGHKPVCELTKQDWQFAYDAARKIRAGAAVTIDPPLPLESLVTDDPEQMAGHERVTSLIGAMKRIQQHARFLDLTAIKPDDLIIKPVKKRKNSRSRKGKPFSMREVETIFSGYIYQGTPPANRTKAYPFWFWMPLVAYFTGARTNEIAQLDTADIREIDGHPCFDFCPDDPKAFEAKRVKTEEARQAPIHPRLIELGFLDYVASQRTAKQKKLFGDGLAYLPPRDETSDHNKEGWAKSASKFFNEAPKGYLVAIGVHYPKSGKSLYSFRHTLETNLQNARRDGKTVDQTVIDAITGHAPDTIAAKHYDGGATIEHKLSALKLLPVPNAITRLTSYKVDFVDRFGDKLTKSIESHRQRHPRII
ncbi:site-specific integrase [Stutzerimonas stutzeri]|uniref:site-specific integrase n=1 Tax=Stutzerimonas stutzeri TaxID=316 RepID=UPI001CFEED53|nr:site-specific integrase [Stutzerimonas stutzeri]